MTRVPERRIEVSETSGTALFGRDRLVVGKEIDFRTEALETYGCKRWDPLVYDSMVVAASIEYADRTVRRPSGGWGRSLSLSIAVHEPSRWQDPGVSAALRDALGFLTGDVWNIEFSPRSGPAPSPSQEFLPLSSPAKKVLPYSDGMDSLAVAGILKSQIGDGLVLVRLGSSGRAIKERGTDKMPFLGVPYEVRTRRAHEASGRSRGFKFSLLGGIAAYLSEADTIVIPESGQGSIGTALVTVAHAHPDYRNHPRFLQKMAAFMSLLFERPLRFEYPRLWSTKGETLREYLSLYGGTEWTQTKSCWRSNRWSAVDGRHRQCGVCAACMLRRLSVHAAGEPDEKGRYICEDLRSESLKDGIHPRYEKFNKAFAEYACAGTLHLDHLTTMSEPMAKPERLHHAIMLARALERPVLEIEENLESLLVRHAAEWRSFRDALGDRSFINQWARGNG